MRQHRLCLASALCSCPCPGDVTVIYKPVQWTTCSIAKFLILRRWGLGFERTDCTRVKNIKEPVSYRNQKGFAV